MERSIRAFVAALTVSAGLIALSASSAFAANGYVCQISGSGVASPSECNGSGNSIPGGGLTSPAGLTTDSAGNLWVSDGANPPIDKFDPNGNFLAQGIGEGNWSGGIGAIAFNGQSGKLDVSDGIKLWELNPDGSYVDQLAFQGMQYGPRIAVDSSGKSTNGDLYFSYFNYGLFRYDASGSPANFTASVPYVNGNEITGTPSHPYQPIVGTATNLNGDLFVVDFASAEVDEYDSTGQFIRAITGSPSGPFVPYGSLSSVATDPTTGDIFIADGALNVVHVYDSAGNFISDITGTATPTGNFGSIGAIAVDPGGRIYIADPTNNVIDVFAPTVVVPGVAYNAVSDVTQTGGTVNATVDPHGGGDITSCTIEYGLDTKYSGGSMACSPTIPPNYAVPTNVSGPLSGLTPDTTYHYRVVVSNANGTRLGADQTFTPHAVAGIQTDPPTAVYPVGATLNGSWIGSGDDTSYHFEWGPTAAHGNSTPTTDAGATTGNTPVHFDLSGLTPEHTYHYRIVASNGIGTSVGEDRSFTTPPAVSDLSTDPVSELAPTGATLNGSWTGVGLDTHYHFEWGTDDGYGNTTPDTDAGTTTGHTPGQAQLNGLDPITTYHYRMDATDIYGTTVGPDQTFTTPPNHPLVTQWSSDVHSDSAALHATINPGGADTTYYFEYGTSTSYGTKTPIPDGDVGSSITSQPVSAQLTGLSTGTTYHYHVVAQNSADTTAGPDFTFRTFDYVPTLTDPCPNAHARQQTGAALLPDCRGYELVSASSTGGYDVESDLVPGQNPFGGYPRTGPPKVLYAVHEGGIPGTGDPTNFGPDPYVATRTDNGWSTTYVGIPANGTQSSETFASTLLEADSALDTFAFGGPNICSPCFGDGSTGIPLHLSGGSLVQGMVGSTPQPSATPDGLILEHFSADGTHFVFGSSSQFEADGNSGGDVSVYDRNLRTGTTDVVSKAPAGGNLACLQGAGSCHSPGDGHGIAELGISADGSRILVGQLVSTDANGNERFHLYMNVGDADHTIDVTPGADAGVLYDGMTADGTKVFFTATDQLTADDHDTSADIYRADVSASDASLSRVSTGQGGVGDTDACDPEGGWNSVSGGSNCDAVAIAGGGGVASGDGTVYFLSPELLSGVGAGTANEPNLYVARPGSGPHFVATLETGNPAVDHAVTQAGTRSTGDFQVTPSGDFSAFVSDLALVDYDNHGYTEVYRYSAQSDRIDCASCNPTRARATGDASMAPDGLSLGDDGRVFFTSSDALAPRDLDNRRDAYEWENGEVGLISTGISRFDSSLLSADADGSDAYFFTRDTLVPEDHNGSLAKIYDAREGGGFPYSVEPVPCKASDECHGAGTKAPDPPVIHTITGAGPSPQASSTKPPHKKHPRHHKKHPRHHKKHKRKRKVTRHHG